MKQFYLNFYILLFQLIYQVSVTEWLVQQTVDVKVAGSDLSRIFYVTSRCLLEESNAVAEWSNLSFTSPELLAHTVGCRLESYQWLFSSLLSCLLKKKIYPTLFCIMCSCSCHIIVRSGVVPKTTWLSGSIQLLLYACDAPKYCDSGKTL